MRTFQCFLAGATLMAGFFISTGTILKSPTADSKTNAVFHGPTPEDGPWDLAQLHGPTPEDGPWDLAQLHGPTPEDGPWDFA